MRKSLVAILSSLAICVVSSSVYAESNSSKIGSNTEPAKVYHKSERHERWCKTHPGVKSCHKYHRHHHHHRHHYRYRDDYRYHGGVRKDRGMMEQREDRNLEDHR